MGLIERITVILVLFTLVVGSLMVPLGTLGDDGTGPAAGSREDFFAGFRMDERVRVSTTTNLPKVPTVATMSDDKAYVTWADGNQILLSTVQDGTDTDIKHLLLMSAPLSTQHDVDSYTQYMDVDSKGNIHITAGAWGAGRYYRFDPSGTMTINAMAPGTDTHNSMGVQTGPEDHAHILYIDTGHRIRYSSVDPSGNLVVTGVPFTVTAYPGHPKNRFVTDGEPNLRVASFNDSSDKFQYLKVSDQGTLLEIGDLFDTTGADPPEPDVTHTPDGMTHFAWTTSFSGGTLKYMRVDDKGVVDAGPMDLSGASDCLNPPRIAGDQNGNAYIVWTDDSSGTMTVTLTVLEKDAIQAPSEDFTLTDGVLDSRSPDIDIDDEGGMHIVYLEDSGTGTHVYYTHGLAFRGVDAYFAPAEVLKAGTISPGGHTIINVSIWNNGTPMDTFGLRTLADLPPGWSVELGADNVDLRGNETVLVPVDITAPGNAHEGQGIEFQVEAVSKEHPLIRDITDKVVTVVEVVHGLDLEVPAQPVETTAGVPVEMEVKVTNIGDVKEFAALTVVAPSNWSAVLASDDLSIEAGVSRSVTVTITPPVDVLAGSYGIDVGLAFFGSEVLVETGTLTVQVPVERSFDMWAEVTEMMTAPYRPVEFEIVLENENNAGYDIVASLDLLSEYSTDLLNITLETTEVDVPVNGQARVKVTATPMFDVEVGEDMNFSINATVASPVTFEGSVNLSIVIGRSIVILRVEDPDRIVLPGDKVRFGFSLTNAGEFEETVAVTTRGLPGTWNRSIDMVDGSDPDMVRLGVRETIDGHLTVIIPEGRDDVGRTVDAWLMASYDDKLFSLNISIEVRDMWENRPPAFTTEPPTKAVVGQTYEYRARAEDPDEGDLMFFGTSVRPVNLTLDQHRGTVTWTPVQDEVGPHHVTIYVSDGMSEVSQSWFIEVIPEVVTHEPTCLITGPEDGTKVEGKFRVSGTATFPNLGGWVEVRVDDGDWKKATGEDMWYLDIDSQDLKKGDHVIWARAVQGNMNSTPVSVHVDVKDRSGTSVGLGSDWLPLALLVVVLVIGTILLFRRFLFRSEEAMPEELEEEEEVEARSRFREPEDLDEYPEEEGFPEEFEEEPLPGAEPEAEPEPEVLEGIFEKLEREAPDHIPAAAPMGTTEEEASEEGPVDEVVKEPPPEEVDVDMDSEVAELERMFEQEEKVEKEKMDKGPEKKEDVDLDSILAKLASDGGDKE